MKELRVGQTQGFRLWQNRSLGLVPEMGKMEQAVAQEKSLECKVRSLYIFFFHVENKGSVRV